MLQNGTSEIPVVYLGRGSRHPSFSGIGKSYGRTIATDEARRYRLAMEIDKLLMIAGIEQAEVPALRVAFTLAVIMFLLGGVFIWRSRHQFFNPDPNVENDVPVVRRNREEAIIFVWSGIILVLISILYRVWTT